MIRYKCQNHPKVTPDQKNEFDFVCTFNIYLIYFQKSNISFSNSMLFFKEKKNNIYICKIFIPTSSLL